MTNEQLTMNKAIATPGGQPRLANDQQPTANR
jgi:hypothetical protein